MTGDPRQWGAEAPQLFSGARDDAGLKTAVVRFHKTVDAVIDATVRGHAVEIACRRGCAYCCHMPVRVQASEALVLAEWLRAHFTSEALAGVLDRARANAAQTEAMGMEARSRMNLACALLGEDGACTAYEARPAHCRKFHSVRLATCEASYAHPEDDSILTPEHDAVAHNAAVIIAQARQATRGAGLDGDDYELNRALADALDNPKVRRRWRDGKKFGVRPQIRPTDANPANLGSDPEFP